MSEIIKKQIKAIKDSGKVDMLEYKSVKMYAFSKGYYQLASFIYEDENAYLRYIFSKNLLT